jgi:hypothetical protein
MANTTLSKTHFQGGLQSGQQTGNPGTDTRANVRLSRTVTVSAASSANVMLPGDATMLNFRTIITTGSAGTGGTVTFGTTTDATGYASMTNVSAAGVYSTLSTVSAANLVRQVGSDNIVVVRGSAANAQMLGVAEITFQRGNG